jgi:hypothetical protein
MRKQFGAEFDAYAARTPRFLPPSRTRASEADMKKTRWRQRINRPYLAAAYGPGDGCGSRSDADMSAAPRRASTHAMLIACDQT